MPFIKDSDCLPEATYHFRGKMHMQIITSPKNNKDTFEIMKFTSYFNDSAKTIAVITNMEMGEMINSFTVLVNMKDTQIIVLMDMGTIKFATCYRNFMNAFFDTLKVEK